MICSKCGAIGNPDCCSMTHDIQDLLNLIKELEERILMLETQHRQRCIRIDADDAWYWDH